MKTGLLIAFAALVAADTYNLEAVTELAETCIL
jgi:hypothetical protein